MNDGAGMLEFNNLGLFFRILIFPLLYASIVWLSTPRGSVKWKVAFLYFLMGILSTTFVLNLQWIFPNWFNKISSDDAINLLIVSFLQIALVEEFFKFSVFKITDSYRNKKFVEHPAATMFYVMSIGCGFAVSENILYVETLGDRVLWMRTFTALLMHMSFGLMMGYFIVRGRLSKSDGVSEFSRFSPKVRYIFWNILAILAATSLHGSYDFFLDKFGSMGLSFNQEIVSQLAFVFISLLLVFALSRKIFRKPHEQRNSLPPKSD